MPTPEYITIPKSEYESLVREVRRGAEVCGEIGDLRLKLQDLGDAISKVVKACTDTLRLRTELFALERRLREFDQELTPVRPPSRTDIEVAFKNATDFASGKKKPPQSG